MPVHGSPQELRVIGTSKIHRFFIVSSKCTLNAIESPIRIIDARKIREEVLGVWMDNFSKQGVWTRI
jgi:hypothetical protein